MSDKDLISCDRCHIIIKPEELKHNICPVCSSDEFLDFGNKPSYADLSKQLQAKTQQLDTAVEAIKECVEDFSGFDGNSNWSETIGNLKTALDKVKN